jgi:hypothetical protein
MVVVEVVQRRRPQQGHQQHHHHNHHRCAASPSAPQGGSTRPPSAPPGSCGRGAGAARPARAGLFLVQARTWVAGSSASATRERTGLRQRACRGWCWRGLVEEEEERGAEAAAAGRSTCAPARRGAPCRCLAAATTRRPWSRWTQARCRTGSDELVEVAGGNGKFRGRAESSARARCRCRSLSSSWAASRPARYPASHTHNGYTRRHPNFAKQPTTTNPKPEKGRLWVAPPSPLSPQQPARLLLAAPSSPLP